MRAFSELEDALKNLTSFLDHSILALLLVGQGIARVQSKNCAHGAVPMACEASLQGRYSFNSWPQQPRSCSFMGMGNLNDG